MNTYKLVGTYRKIGAIGIHENFEYIVRAETPHKAYQEKIKLYDTHEHIIIKAMKEIKGKKEVNINCNEWLLYPFDYGL